MIDFNERHLGFTGTRGRISPWQYRKLEQVLSICAEDYDVFHHGGCEGADTVAHLFAEELGFAIVVHPGPKTDITPFLSHTILPRKANLERNHDIVLASSLVLAVPATKKEILRSGTWATVRFARTQQIELEVLYP